MAAIDHNALRSLFLSPAPRPGKAAAEAATFALPAAHDLLVTVDTMVEGVHFSAGIEPRSLGHKLMAVNLSDLAAMGAHPRWASLALVLPAWELDWLQGLQQGLQALGGRYGVEFLTVECDTGPLNLTLQAYGVTPCGSGLLRRGAQPGDRVYVTGSLGDAGLALQYRLQGREMPAAYAGYLNDRLDHPQPRVEAGVALRGIASSAIDISDGLAADLGHILAASAVGAELYAHQLPLSKALSSLLDSRRAWQYALSAGDDYELCFTVAPAREAEVAALSRELDLAMSCVGVIRAGAGVSIVDAGQQPLVLERKGYEHFG